LKARGIQEVRKFGELTGPGSVDQMKEAWVTISLSA